MNIVSVSVMVFFVCVGANSVAEYYQSIYIGMILAWIGAGIIIRAMPKGRAIRVVYPHRR